MPSGPSPERSTPTATRRSRAYSARNVSPSSSALPRRKRICDRRDPLAHQNWKRARADLGVKRAMIRRGNMIEAARLVGDHAGETSSRPVELLGLGGGEIVQPQDERR